MVEADGRICTHGNTDCELLPAKIWVLIGKTTVFAPGGISIKVFSRVADVLADRELPIWSNIAVDRLPDRLGYGVVVLNPVFEMIAVDEKVVDIIFVIVWRHIMSPPAIESSKPVVAAFCPVVLF
jgi:hypothetical protein